MKYNKLILRKRDGVFEFVVFEDNVDRVKMDTKPIGCFDYITYWYPKRKKLESQKEYLINYLIDKMNEECDLLKKDAAALTDLKEGLK